MLVSPGQGRDEAAKYFLGARLLIVDDDLPVADVLARALRELGAEVALVGKTGRGVDLVDSLDPEVVLVEDSVGEVDQLRARLMSSPRLRWARVLAFRAKELFPHGDPTHHGKPTDGLFGHRLAALGERLAPALAPERALARAASDLARFEVDLAELGPVRALRALASVASGEVLRLELQTGSRRCVVEVSGEQLIGCEVFEAEGQRLEGIPALARFLELEDGDATVQRRSAASKSNLLKPVIVAVERAADVLASAETNRFQALSADALSTVHRDLRPMAEASTEAHEEVTRQVDLAEITGQHPSIFDDETEDRTLPSVPPPKLLETAKRGGDADETTRRSRALGAPPAPAVPHVPQFHGSARMPRRIRSGAPAPPLDPRPAAPVKRIPEPPVRAPGVPPKRAPATKPAPSPKPATEPAPSPKAAPTPAVRKGPKPKSGQKSASNLMRSTLSGHASAPPPGAPRAEAPAPPEPARAEAPRSAPEPPQAEPPRSAPEPPQAEPPPPPATPARDSHPGPPPRPPKRAPQAAFGDLAPAPMPPAPTPPPSVPLLSPVPAETPSPSPSVPLLSPVPAETPSPPSVHPSVAPPERSAGGRIWLPVGLVLIAAVVVGWILIRHAHPAEPVVTSLPSDPAAAPEAVARTAPVPEDGPEATPGAEAPAEAGAPAERAPEALEEEPEPAAPEEEPEPEAPEEEPAAPVDEGGVLALDALPPVPVPFLPDSRDSGHDRERSEALRAEAAGRVGEARLRYLAAAASADRGNPHAVADIAEHYSEAGEHPLAEAWAREAVRLRRRRAAYRLLLGDVLAAAGKRAEARQAWEQAVELDADSPAASRLH